MKKSLGSKPLIYPQPLLVVGSYDKEGNPNLMTAAWGGICSSNPPSVSVSIRDNRYSYQGIIDRKSFTINILSESLVKEADFYGISSGKDCDKFEKTGITPVKSDCVDAPYGKEFPVVLECALSDTLVVGVHTLFIGEIKNVLAEESVLTENDTPDPQKIKPIVFDFGTKNYYGLGDIIGRAFSSGKEIM